MNSKNTAQQKLEYYKEKFEPVFVEYFNRIKKEKKYPSASQLVPESLTAIQKLSLRGGKRQRVAFLYESFHLFSSKKEDSFLKECAISIELLQTHLLIHDDIIDNSPTRRGGPTVHIELANILSEKKLDIHKAQALAILSGDITAYLAIDVLLENNDISAGQLKKIIGLQISAGLDTFLGQIFDIERDMSLEFSENDLVILADFKAVRSSTLIPMLIGLVLSYTDDASHCASIGRYALNIGIAAQIQDDILGLFGNPNVTGKSTTSDISEGKRTLLIRSVLERCSKKDILFIESVLGKKVSNDDVEKVKKLIINSGSYDYVVDVAKKYAMKATDEVKKWHDSNQDSRQFFNDIAMWAINRKL